MKIHQMIKSSLRVKTKWDKFKHQKQTDQTLATPLVLWPIRANLSTHHHLLSRWGCSTNLTLAQKLRSLIRHHKLQLQILKTPSLPYNSTSFQMLNPSLQNLNKLRSNSKKPLTWQMLTWKEFTFTWTSTALSPTKLLKLQRKNSKMKLSKVSTSPTKSSTETKENYIKVKLKMIKYHLTLRIYEVNQSPDWTKFREWRTVIKLDDSSN